MTIGVLFVPLGTWLKLKYADVVELAQQYDGPGTTAEGCSISAANEGKEVSRHKQQFALPWCSTFNRAAHKLRTPKTFLVLPC